MSSHEGLADFYKTYFIMQMDYNMSLTELENMLPWERDIFLGLLANRIKDKEAMRARNAS